MYNITLYDEYLHFYNVFLLIKTVYQQGLKSVGMLLIE